MDISELILRENIILPLQSCAVAEIHQEMVERLVENHQLPAAKRAEALNALAIREDQMSTAIGLGIALPHAAVEGLEQTIGAIGITKSAVECESLDEVPVRLIVLLLMPKNDFQNHLRSLAQVAKFFNQPQRVEQLMACGTVEQFQAVLLSAKG